MKLILCLILALIGFDVAAQPAVPPCFAKPLGTGTYAVTKKLPDGAEWSRWYCAQTPTFPFQWEMIVMAKAPGVTLTWPKLDGLNTQQSLEAVWRANVALSCDAPSIKQLCLDAIADARASKDAPPNPVYVVSKNGTTLTRPVYAYASPASGVVGAGTVGKSITGKRATVGASCGCASRGVMNNGNAYCIFLGGAIDELTACSKLAP